MRHSVRHFRHACWASLIIAIASCSREAKKPVSPPASSPSTSTSGSDSAAPSDASTKSDSAGTTEPDADSAAAGSVIEGPTGRIEGAVTFSGSEIPKSTLVVNGTDPAVCGAEVSKLDMVISPETRGIRYVLVWLEDVKLPDGYKPPLQKLILDNVKCQFEPHAAVITVGSTIETRNSDDVFHTTNLYGRMTNENIPLVSKGSMHKTRVRGAELIGVKCDKHGWMQAYIRVDPHPFHAVTDADGKFAIAGVPVGTYKLKAWHETFYGQDFDVEVKVDETTKLEIQYPTAEK